MPKKPVKPIATTNSAPTEKRYKRIEREFVFKYPSMLWVEVEEEKATGKKAITIVRGNPEHNYWENLRIRKPEYWKKIKEIVEGRMVDVAGWDRKALQIDISKITQEQLKSLHEQVNELSKPKHRQKASKEQNAEANKELLTILGKKEVELAKAVSELKHLKTKADNFQIKQLKSEIPKLEKELKQFEKLVNDKTKKEEDYHVFLKEHSWLFGSNYIEVKSKPEPNPKDHPDFLLKRYDGFHDVVEIESANDSLFAPKSKRLKMTTALKDAVSEIMDYIDAYIQETMKQFYVEQREVYKPKGLVIIGKRKKGEERELKQLNSFLHDIEVITFNDLIERANKRLDLIRKHKG